MRLRFLLGSAILAITLVPASFAGTPPHTTRHRWRTFLATAYCRSGETQSGTETRPGVAAADPHVLPTGSVVRVRGLGDRDQTFSVEDHGVRGHHLDIFIRSCQAAKRFGRRLIAVRAVKIGDGKRVRTDGREVP